MTAEILPLIDTHIHFWDTTHAELTYGWLAPDSTHPILGRTDAIKSVAYEIEDFVAESRFAQVVGAVHVQAAVGTPDPVAETRWLTEMASRSAMPLVIVAGVSLSAPDVDDQLDAHGASPLLRGVRDYGREDYLDDPAFHRGVARLSRRGLLLDLDCAWPDMPKARALATTVPDTPIVLEHIGYPRDTENPEYFAQWKQGIAKLAEAENVWCKISGLGMNRRGWTLESLRPWVEHCIETFGIERCMWGSNWPVDRLYASYDAYATAFRRIIAQYSPAEREAMTSGTAIRVYGVPVMRGTIG